MANAGQACEEGNLRKRVSRIDTEGWRSFRPLCRLERSILRRVYRIGGCRECGVLRPVRSNRSAGPDQHPNGTKTPLRLFVALRSAFFSASVYGDATFAPRPGPLVRLFFPSLISVWR